VADDQTAALIARARAHAAEREAEGKGAAMLWELADALEYAERENQTLAAHNVILMGRIDDVREQIEDAFVAGWRAAQSEYEIDTGFYTHDEQYDSPNARPAAKEYARALSAQAKP
jgi:hypothetical protein